MAITCFFSQWNHKQALPGGWQCMPLLRVVFEHDLVLLVVHDHSMTSLIINAEQWVGLISSTINQVHVDRLPTQ